MPLSDEILVVEDNEQNLELVQYLLEDAGLSVRVARDADDLRVALAGSSLPDLVLMDMQLPGVDGMTLVQEIRRSPATSHIRVVALTAHAMRGDRERFLAGGCDGYLSKPIDAVHFAEQVRSFLAEPPPSHGVGEKP